MGTAFSLGLCPFRLSRDDERVVVTKGDSHVPLGGGAERRALEDRREGGAERHQCNSGGFVVQIRSIGGCEMDDGHQECLELCGCEWAM